MKDFSRPVEVSLGRQGRVVITESLRRSLGFDEGDALVARQEVGRLVLEKPVWIKQRLKERFARVPGDRSLTDELIAERREEGRRDAGE
ncbi:AbrB/MazE/SpoVT family DNA-binding domain-containing protein [Synechococcus sp. CS-1325]|uniref:AbrB/MazE/SpoVT family DNA-binding domain-containing protein n=1 Tax=unclassified Synechococcus TaxID=2626047 RepID=UPI000DB2C1A1|nr:MULTISPECIES: AbrB/MazE/SpoVT family DNA-binding domain-containing protein [unclassified Synechococcus]MCT0200494.1 AbrB/MazE/SpoVT family DNA-binding domain-containing protein [Synechococcus sp. CS-1325]MCT0213462.1 AbrB/MazE/SpoVT family DNA-binding domain-containing protein [Synechococcus sp. CS-1326]MCT0232684.1 AbrB/MazE/SpoVT family DNA-binding domain-containing protein [Synechococcus sp. CS-1327]PZV00840.1 MAG: AbrB family transcriptional regulator [Cyanobium sp.]